MLNSKRASIDQKFFNSEGGQTLEQVSQRDGRCPILGNIPSQVQQGSEQPDLVEDVTAYSGRVGVDDLQRSLPMQTIL